MPKRLRSERPGEDPAEPIQTQETSESEEEEKRAVVEEETLLKEFEKDVT